jgi:hypothetical protein
MGIHCIEETEVTQNISRVWSMTCQKPFEWRYLTLASAKETNAYGTSKNGVKRERTQQLR